MKRLDTRDGLYFESAEKVAETKVLPKDPALLKAAIEAIDPGDGKKLVTDPKATLIWCIEKGAEIPDKWWVEPEVEITVNGMSVEEWVKSQIPEKSK